MLKNILLVLLILLPAALYIYMVSRDDGTASTTPNQHATEQQSPAKP
ncbi:hypothetical protein [Acinetobacter sp. ANC 3813]|nr:hypothetical protein [Acinetobacter sp. ANC 3813]